MIGVIWNNYELSKITWRKRCIRERSINPTGVVGGFWFFSCQESDTPQISCEESCTPPILKRSNLLTLPKMCLKYILKPFWNFLLKIFFHPTLNFLRRIKRTPPMKTAKNPVSPSTKTANNLVTTLENLLPPSGDYCVTWRFGNTCRMPQPIILDQETKGWFPTCHCFHIYSTVFKTTAINYAKHLQHSLTYRSMELHSGSRFNKSLSPDSTW